MEEDTETEQQRLQSTKPRFYDVGDAGKLWVWGKQSGVIKAPTVKKYDKMWGDYKAGDITRDELMKGLNMMATTEKMDKIWIHSKKEGVKRQVDPMTAKLYVEEEGWKYGQPIATPAETTAPASLKERQMQNIIKGYGAPRNNLGYVMEMQPKAKTAKIKNWFSRRALEEKKGQFTKQDLDAIQSQLFTEWGISPEVQDGIQAAIMAGATDKQIAKLLEQYQENLME